MGLLDWLYRPMIVKMLVKVRDNEYIDPTNTMLVTLMKNGLVEYQDKRLVLTKSGLEALKRIQ
jgi:hypothetical protein